MLSNFRKNQAGFTMIELLVVATIIVVLSAVGLASFRQAGISARNSRRKADLENVRQALVLYKTDNGNYPVHVNSTATGANYRNMINDLDAYLSSTSVVDPKNSGGYIYRYYSDGTSFTLSGRLEPNETPYSITNP